MKSVLVIFGLVLSSALSRAHSCPDFVGTFEQEKDRYEISRVQIKGREAYLLNHDGILSPPMFLDKTDADSAPALGSSVTEKLTCAQGIMVYQDLYAGTIDETHFELNVDGDLIISESLRLPSSPFVAEALALFKRTK